MDFFVCCCADLPKEKKNRWFLGSKESEKEVKVFLWLLSPSKRDGSFQYYAEV